MLLRRPPCAGHTPWLAYLCLGSSMAVVGSYVGLSKVLVAVFPVFLLAWLRFGFSALAMVGWLRARSDETPLTRRSRSLLFIESFFGNFLFSICMLYGVSLSRHASDAAKNSVVGNLLLFGAVCCEAIYVVVGKLLAGALGPKRISAIINLWGFALVMPWGVWQALAFNFSAVTNSSWALLAGYSIAASTVTVWLWMTGLRDVDASTAGTFSVLLPISAAAVGVVFLGERFGTAQTIAFALALAGVVLATWPRRPPSPEL